jgi:hypothetical protein
VLGELKISGYSIPAPDRRGHDARHRPGGDRRVSLGTQISIFDVSDLRSPALYPALVGLVGGRADHHAFLFWPKTGLSSSRSVEGRRLPGSRSNGVVDLGRIERRGRAPVDADRRSLVVGNSVHGTDAASRERPNSSRPRAGPRSRHAASGVVPEG